MFLDRELVGYYVLWHDEVVSLLKVNIFLASAYSG